MKLALSFFASIIVTIIARNGVKSNYEKCGIANEEIMTPRIFGGNIVSRNKYPWMAVVYTKQYFTIGRCGGSLISNRVILTAAHCVHGVDADYIDVLIGTDDLACRDEKRKVKHVYTHHDFNESTYASDIAILILEESVEYSENIRPICLPPKKMEKDDKFVVAGWGRTNEKRFSRFLRHVTLTKLPLKKCSTTWHGRGYEVSRKNICAGDIGKDSCDGDSGGPLMQIINGTYYLAGITSFGELKCGTSNNAVYTRTRSYNGWIKNITEPYIENITKSR